MVGLWQRWPWRGGAVAKWRRLARDGRRAPVRCSLAPCRARCPVLKAIRESRVSVYRTRCSVFYATPVLEDGIPASRVLYRTRCGQPKWCNIQAHVILLFSFRTPLAMIRCAIFLY
ncbi:hypothetical protein PVAP13_8KG253503 [Panicum virgatum]|uniref:Uncharacterized protein n=1 Tax=Panicum virgatum TaxID=38727 RepID=A0A8T0PW99_PANVG|nr:hypothetical protein PVAP13_8KG253503 [Panicum virgatum]